MIMIKNKEIKKILILNIILLLISVKTVAQLNVVPYPNKVEIYEGINLFENIEVRFEPNLMNEFKALKNLFKKSKVEVIHSKSNKANLELVLNNNLLSDLGDEGYKLNIANKKIVITAVKPAGIFYGIQTLKQLSIISKTGTKKSKVAFPSVLIVDKPAFKWRAFMLDESRHFKGKKVVFEMLDQMALLKMNVFHWHLTDDQGWRIEIKKYPLLTEIGGTRSDTQINGVKSTRRRGKPHSGYYTQEEIKEVIEYAKNIHITIVPEIEMPGHASAAIAAYPWLGTLDHPIEVPVTFGILHNIFNVTDPRVYNFIEDVLKEVIDLFPGKIVHIGGDEAKFDQWENNAKIQKYMEGNNLKSFSDVQIFFTNKVSNFMVKNEYRMMGWNDILGDNLHHWNKDSVAKSNQKLAENVIIHFWKGSRGLMISALTKGHDVVNSQHNYTYLDYDFNSISLEKAYSFNPIPNDIDENLKVQILGLGCQMWGEWIPKVSDLYRQVFPRLAAYAEVGWTQNSSKDFKRFKESVKTIEGNWRKKTYFSNNLNSSNVTVTFNVDMNSSKYLKQIEGGKEVLTLSGTFKNESTNVMEYWHANGVTLTDYDYDGVYTGTKVVPKNSTLLFILLASPEGSWNNHVKIFGDKSCSNVTVDNNYKLKIATKNITISFKAGGCL